MFLKRFVFRRNLIFAALIFIAIFLTSCAAQPTSSAVQVSDALKVAINGALLFLVMAGLQALFDFAGLDLRGIGAAVAVALSEFVILQLQGVIDTIPAQYDMLVTVGLNILLAVLSGLGFFQITARRERIARLFSRG